MFENFNQPYIINNNFKHSIKTIFLVSMVFMLLMLYFQPFGINFFKSAHDGYFVLGAGILTSLIFFISTLVLPGIFPKTFDPQKWTIKKEIIQNVCVFVVLSVSFALLAWVFALRFIDNSLPLFRTGALALLPIVLFNFVNYNSALKMKVVKVFDSGKQWLAEERKIHQPVIKFVSENGRETLTVETDKLIMLRSSGNYVEVFYQEGQITRKSLIRQTLTNLESLVMEHPQFQRSHRCCLINTHFMNKIVNASGNYTIQMNGLDFEVPVSRSKIIELKNLVSKRNQ